jgi:signal transduction histidine kinase
MIEGLITDDGEKIIKVIDNAGGIPDEIIKDIFKPHFTTKQQQNGTGIGLYMSQQILKKLNGDINAQNVETPYGKGASFNLVLSERKEKMVE